jgi:hypothetical protein
MLKKKSSLAVVRNRGFMKTFKILLTSLIVVNSVSAYADNDAKYQQCAVDLCGPSSKYARVLAKGIFAVADRDTKAFITQEIDPKLEQLLDLALKEKKQSKVIGDAYVKSGSPLSLSQKSVLGVLSSVNRIQKVLNDCIVSPDGRLYQISASKLQEKMPKLSAAEVNEITSILNAYLKTDGFSSGSNVSSYTYDLLLESWGAYPSFYLSLIREKATKLIEQLGPFVESRLNLPLLERMNKKETLSAFEKTEAIGLIEKIYRLNGMADEQVQAVVGPMNISPQSAAKAMAWDENLKKFNLVVSNPDKVKFQRDKVLNHCREAITKSLAATPSALRQRKANELLQKVKASALAVAPQYFSGKSLGMVEQSIQTVKFMLPKNAQEVKDKNQSILNEELRLSGGTQLLIDKAQYDLSAQQSLGLFAVTGDPTETEKLFQSVQYVCDKITPQNFDDSAFQRLGTIRTSWQSNMFPEIGVGVLAHELGHIISYVVKDETVGNENFKETRTCAASVHAQLVKSSDIKAFAQFEEEDWADSFALSTVNYLQKSWPYVENFECSLIEQFEDEDKDKDREITNRPYKGLQLFDERNADTHSSSFLRALQAQVGLGKPLPASCMKVLTENEKAILGKVCGK